MHRKVYPKHVDEDKEQHDEDNHHRLDSAPYIFDPNKVLEFEIPSENKEGDDNYDSDESSLHSNTGRESPSKRSASKKSPSQKQIISHLQQQRNEMKEQIVAEVLEKILPDIDNYDIDGTAHAPKINYSKVYQKAIDWMKFFGCIELDLHDAVLCGSKAQVRASLLKLTQGKDANPELINEYDQHGCTPLSYAVKIKSYDIVQIILDYDAVSDLVDMKTNRTPFFYSVSNGTLEISKILLRAGASVNAVDNQCVSPLMLAATRNDVKHAQLLCRALADVDIQDDNGWTALHYAAYGNSPDIIYYLLGEGANRHVKDRNRRKPIHLAKFLKHGNCIAALSSKSKITFDSEDPHG
jgi:ankyrin repeat protein